MKTKHHIENYEYLQNQLQIGNWSYLKGFDEQLLDKTISVFGIGGSGSPMVLNLTRMGFKNIILVDKDTVEKKNLTRQVLYGVKDVGNEKTKAALENLNSYHTFQSAYEAHQMDIIETLDKTEAIIQKSDFVFNLVYNDIALYHISAICRKFQKACIYFGTGVVARMTSTVMYQAPDNGICIPCMHGLPTDLKEITHQFKNKKYGVTPSWYPTPALGSAFSAVILIKSLLQLPIKHNFIITSLYAISVEKLHQIGDDDCRICSKTNK